MSTLVRRWLLLGRILDDPRLGGTDAAVAWHLLEMFNQRSGGSWPSYATLACRVGKHRTTVIASVGRLIAAGYFERASGGGRGRSNVYKPRLETVARTRPIKPENSSVAATVSSPAETVASDSINGRNSRDKGSSRHDPNPLNGTRSENPPKEGEGEDALVSRSATADEICEMVQCWNEVAKKHQLPTVQKITKRRRQSAIRALRELGGLAGWRAALARVEGSGFLRGHNDRGWRANFDFMVRPDKAIRLLEGDYDDAAPAPSGPPPPRRDGLTDEELESAAHSLASGVYRARRRAAVTADANGADSARAEAEFDEAHAHKLAALEKAILAAWQRGAPAAAVRAILDGWPAADATPARGPRNAAK